MGTNYYFYDKPVRECCGRDFESRHIGKSSAGWCFSLHLIPEDGINSLDDWRKLWSTPGSVIKNEYGEEVSVGDIEKTICQRSWNSTREYPNGRYKSEKEFLRENSATEGPSGLVRHAIDGRHCVGHGEGTWDYIIGDFS
jgi:hypothetical protein